MHTGPPNPCKGGGANAHNLVATRRFPPVAGRQWLPARSSFVPKVQQIWALGLSPMPTVQNYEVVLCDPRNSKRSTLADQVGGRTKGLVATQDMRRDAIFIGLLPSTFAAEVAACAVLTASLVSHPTC